MSCGVEPVDDVGLEEALELGRPKPGLLDNLAPARPRRSLARRPRGSPSRIATARRTSGPGPDESGGSRAVRASTQPVQPAGHEIGRALIRSRDSLGQSPAGSAARAQSAQRPTTVTWVRSTSNLDPAAAINQADRFAAPTPRPTAGIAIEVAVSPSGGRGIPPARRRRGRGGSAPDPRGRRASDRPSMASSSGRVPAALHELGPESGDRRPGEDVDERASAAASSACPRARSRSRRSPRIVGEVDSSRRKRTTDPRGEPERTRWCKERAIAKSCNSFGPGYPRSRSQSAGALSS